ncbi:hypothetical protein [Streptomyces flavofungini]|nr:hypothetical protein [Streptomyces flavofungini]WJV47761.1 hypothetical protein QUY26_20895 [Streptomyces flavofungini]
MVTDSGTRAELPAVEGLAVATFEELARAAAATPTPFSIVEASVNGS